MEYELTWLTVTLLFASGIIASCINVLAGGGSLLTLPALMLLGMPADIANATNRVGVFLQSVEGVRGFHRHGMFASEAILPILVPTVSGSLVGALVASYLPATVLEPVLLTTMIAMAVLMVLRPSVVVPPAGTIPLSVNQSPLGWVSLFAAGLYGGFVQAAVGFVLIAALAGALRYDLVRANALKLACTGIFSLVALVVFVARGQVLWVPGLILAAGMVIGVRLSVRFAISVDQKVLRWFLLVMVVVVCLAAWFK
ncbi:MAG: permease [Gammaproteobacteria bacterium BRH_c0]|nr:MAG: permease [Gammaproteobacteria bacterium BRH_c0]